MCSSDLLGLIVIVVFISGTMPHSFGSRARTRDLFSRGFRKAGPVGMNTKKILDVFKIGDLVDVIVNSAQHRGMPHKYFHGRTGRVFNITKRSIGVELNKLVRGRIVVKKLHVRVEHVHHSKCQEELRARIARNEAHKKAVLKAGGASKNLKRTPTQPHNGFLIKVNETNAPEVLYCREFDSLV